MLMKGFGTLSERLLELDRGLTVGVTWLERSKEHRFRKFVERIIHLIIPQLNPNKRLAPFDEM